jgi:hypothetical protein
MDDVSDRIVQAGLDRLAALKVQRDAIDAELRLLLPEIQAACGHPEKEIVEGEHQSYSFGFHGVEPPFRVCRRCGYSEQGWDCGYFRLYPNNSSIPRLGRDEARKFVRGGLMSPEEKDRLFRARWDKEAAARVVEEQVVDAPGER